MGKISLFKPHLLLALISICCLISMAPNCHARTDIVYPAPKSETDSRYAYRIELLKAALDATTDEYGSYTIRSSDFRIPPKRIINMINQGDISLTYAPATPALKKNLRAIPIPIMKGILGKRILMIRKERQKEFSSINSLEELSKYVVGQGLGWGDIAIFEHHGFTVETTPYYENLFVMLNKGRFDFFSRGVTEIYQELDERRHILPDLAAEETILLEYDFPVYYFVAKNNESLAKRIRAGLTILATNGMFDIIFQRYFGRVIEKAKLTSRKVFKMHNPNLAR